MNFAVTLSVVQTLYASLQCPKLKDTCSSLGRNPELDHFSNTLSDIRALFLGMKAKEEMSHEVLVWLEELNDAIYDADDLVDELITVQASEEVSALVSRFDPSVLADYMSQWVMNIRGELDVALRENDHQFLSVRRRKEEKYSWMYGNDVIGRDDDVENIVGIMLDSKVQPDVAFLSIVGVGGVGKTALAQIVYNDERAVKAFPLRLWACVSDQDQREFNVDEIVRKIVRSANDHKHNSCKIVQMFDELMELIEGRKYLLVLDDVWTENREQWLKLVEVLMTGQRGSRIIMTTRSKETATEAMQVGATYELQALSEENSRRLFERTAFDDVTPPDNLVEVGHEIVKVCDGIPLAIRVVGGLLYGQTESRWLYFQQYVLTKIKLGKNGIKSILKLSYDHLDPELQSCFSYCALFPRDFEIQKDMLISLWISQGFVVPFEEIQSMEDAGEEYFSILLERCFFNFRDVKKTSMVRSCHVRFTTLCMI